MSRAITPEILRQTLQRDALDLTGTLRVYVRAASSQNYALPARFEGGYISIRFFPAAVDPTAWCDWFVSTVVASVDPTIATFGTPVVQSVGTGKRAVSGDAPVEMILPVAADYGAAQWFLACYGSADGWLEICAT